MSTWRRVGSSGLLAGAIGLAILLPGCGGGGGNTTGPNPEVEIVPPKDAQGNPIRIEDEARPPVVK